MWRKRAGLATEGRLPFVQPLSLTPFDSSPSRGASGETVHFAGTAKASPTRGGGIASAMTERLDEGKPDREPLQRRFTQVSGNIATPRGAGYLAKLEIIVDTSFQIELGQVDQLRLTRPSWNLVSMSNLVRLTNMEYISYIRYYI